MRRLRRRRPLAACAASLLLGLALAACGEDHEPGEAFREGLAEELDGVTYNVFLTRQLNLADDEDEGYAPGLEEAPPGSTYYGVFLEVCNVSDEPLETADSFRIVDTAGNEFEPVELEDNNPFAYEPDLLEPDDCIPSAGSLAASGPSGGALLVFEVPLESVENRPLELEIIGGLDLAEGEPETLLIELDI